MSDQSEKELRPHFPASFSDEDLTPEHSILTEVVSLAGHSARCGISLQSIKLEQVWQLSTFIF